ncbi:hypothetical protein [Sphingopyxis chilensis]
MYNGATYRRYLVSGRLGGPCKLKVERFSATSRIVPPASIGHRVRTDHHEMAAEKVTAIGLAQDFPASRIEQR